MSEILIREDWKDYICCCIPRKPIESCNYCAHFSKIKKITNWMNMIWWNKLDKFLEHNYPEICMKEDWPWKWRYVRPEDLFSFVERIEKYALQDWYKKAIEHRQMSRDLENSNQ